MYKITLKINNGGTMELLQRRADGVILTIFKDENGGPDTDYKNPDELAAISPADMVALINLYRHIKRNDIQNYFINPHGKNNDALRILDRMEEIRQEAAKNPRRYTLDVMARILCAMVADHFGYNSRREWQQALKSDTGNKYHNRIITGNYHN